MPKPELVMLSHSFNPAREIARAIRSDLTERIELVTLFYRNGELFESFAVSRETGKSIPMEAYDAATRVRDW